MQALTVNTARRFLNPKYSDLHVRCGEKEYQVHRALISASDVLAKEVDKAVMEDSICVISITRFGAAALDKMLQFLYREDYSEDPTDSIATIKSPEDEAAMALSVLNLNEDTAGEMVKRLAAHVEVFSIAQYYELSRLEELSVAKFTSERKAHEALSAEDLIRIVAVVYGDPSTASGEMRQQLLSTALVHYREYLAQPEFRQSIIERHDLGQFATNFFASISSYQETEKVHVQQDYQSDIQKLQSQLADVMNESSRAMSQSKAYKAALEEANNKSRSLDKELIGQKYASEANLTEMEQRYQKTANALVAERNKAQADLQAWRQKNEAAEAKQKLNRTTVITLELGNKTQRATIASLETKIAILEAHPKLEVIDQLLELSAISFCRHCKERFYFELERRGPHGYCARCVDCKTRHYAGRNNGSI